MPIPVPVLLIFGAALCGWALLRCIGNECDRRLRTLEERVRAEQAVKAALAAAKEAAAAEGSLAVANAGASRASESGKGAGSSGKASAGKAGRR